MTTIRSDSTSGLVIDSDTSGTINFVTGVSNIAISISSSGTVDLSSSRFVVPVGNTATRSNVLGAFRFNNESNLFEVYNGTNWVNTSDSSFNVEYLVVAGGGAGTNYGAGGGGGLSTGFLPVLTGIGYTVTIGAGATGGSSVSANGSPSSFVITAVGGGGGGATTLPGNRGGSGGGGGYGAAQGGAGIGEGFPGGAGGPGTPAFSAGGGGGASQAGQAGQPTIGGKGGDGAPSFITGANVIYAGGGGGGIFSTPSPIGGAGGAGGGGAGGKAGIGQTSGQTNRGGGGGGGGNTSSTGGSGGSGIVIIKYSNVYTITNPDAGLTFSTNSSNVAGYKITTFTAGTGSIQWST